MKFACASVVYTPSALSRIRMRRAALSPDAAERAGGVHHRRARKCACLRGSGRIGAVRCSPTARLGCAAIRTAARGLRGQPAHPRWRCWPRWASDHAPDGGVIFFFCKCGMKRRGHHAEHATFRSPRHGPTGDARAGAMSPPGMVPRGVGDACAWDLLLHLRRDGAATLRPELLALRVAAAAGRSARPETVPITKTSGPGFRVHVTSVTHAIRRLEADGLVGPGAAPHR